jgi:hypothetical protein
MYAGRRAGRRTGVLTASFTPRRTPAQLVDGFLFDRGFGGTHRPLGAKSLTRFHEKCGEVEDKRGPTGLKMEKFFPGQFWRMRAAP